MAKGEWEEEHGPRTNCLGVHCMADILMDQKEHHMTSEQRQPAPGDKTVRQPTPKVAGQTAGGDAPHERVDLDLDLERGRGAAGSGRARARAGEQGAR